MTGRIYDQIWNSICYIAYAINYFKAMKRVFKTILFYVFIFSYVSFFSQSRISEKDIVMDHDTMFLKKDMHKITGLVCNEHGEVGKFVNGMREGLHKEWYRRINSRFYN